ncbi:Hypothetical protein PBC10988_18920 [Planctomycetales bacterium 10988]|nr:Hypothetical protein PBC10988_18920 [Planctomycetales bacterium 10988]
MDAKLVVINGNASKREIKLRLPMTIGRTKEAGLTVAHPNVSRLHCQLYESNGSLVVRDYNSTNGTFLNDEKVGESVIQPGDKLTVGPLTFVAIYRPAEPSAASSADTADLFGDTENPSTSQHYIDVPHQKSEFPTHLTSQDPTTKYSMGRGQNPDEEETFQFILALENCSDLHVGTPIYGLGQQQGTISELRFDDRDGKLVALAQVSVTPQFGVNLQEDMIVQIERGKTTRLIIQSLGTSGQAIRAGQTLSPNVETGEPSGHVEGGEEGSSLDRMEEVFRKLSEEMPQDQFEGIDIDLSEDGDDFFNSEDLIPSGEQEDWEDVLNHGDQAVGGSDADSKEGTEQETDEPTQYVNDVNDWLKAFADLGDDDSNVDAPIDDD